MTPFTIYDIHTHRFKFKFKTTKLFLFIHDTFTDPQRACINRTTENQNNRTYARWRIEVEIRIQNKTCNLSACRIEETKIKSKINWEDLRRLRIDREVRASQRNKPGFSGGGSQCREARKRDSSVVCLY